MKKATYTFFSIGHHALSEPGRARTAIVIATACAYVVLYGFAFLKGGIPPVYILFNFIFILVAAATLQIPGALVAATLSGILLGPFVTSFVTVGSYTFETSWIFRLVGFELFGLFAGGVLALLRHQAEVVRETTARFMQAQKMESVGQLAGGIAHDFNNVLTVVVGFAEFALSAIDPSSPAHASLTQVLKAAEKGASLSNQLLAFSRRQILHPSVLSLNDVIRDLASMLDRIAGENIATTSSLDPALAPIKIDHSQLEQVIMNLAVNARDAISGAGEIVLTTRNVELTAAHPLFKPEILPGRYVQLSVRDSGSGMSEEVASRVFEPFFTSKPNGTGLGLSTVYGIVKQSKGYIYVRTKEGGGTTFDLFFPAVDLPPAEVKVAAGPGVKEVSGKEQILLVEDDEEIAHLMASTLAARGYTVHAAHSAERALESVTEGSFTPDILVADIVLPGLDGIQLARQLGARLPNLKVLFATGYGREYDPTPIESDGRTAIIQKPYGPNELLSAVKHLLANSRPTNPS